MDELEYRDVEEKDDENIVRCFANSFYQSNSKKDWMREYSEEDLEGFMYEIISQENVCAKVVNETFLVVFQIYSPWFTSNKYIEECLVLRIYQNRVSFDRVVEFFMHMAKENDCKGIMVSTDMHVDDVKLAKKYKKYGFKEQSIKLYRHCNEQELT